MLKLLVSVFSCFPALDLETIHDLFSKLIVPFSTRYQLEALEYMLHEFPILKSQISNHFFQLIHSFEYSNMSEKIKTKSETLEGIFICADKGKNICLKFLLQQGLTREAHDLKGQTLLHIAATEQIDEYTNVSHIRGLLDLGYPIDMLNEEEQTPLHVAIQNGMLIHAVYLIYHGANPRAADKRGRTPLDYAQVFGVVGLDARDANNLEYKMKLIQILKDYGA